jgi:hypothetical protein
MSFVLCCGTWVDAGGIIADESGFSCGEMSGSQKRVTGELKYLLSPKEAAVA